MNTYELMPLLIKAALENDRKTLESVAIMISKKVKSEHPEISKEIVRSLTLDTSTMRAVGNQPIPVDKESRYELADVKFVTETAPPILEAHTYKQLNDFLQERTLINELIEQDILPPNSILLFGAPGVGKTYIANWIAQQLNLPIITLNLASSISSYLGRTGQNIHNVFEYAKSQNAVFFLDELDAIAKRRDDSGDLGELKRLVNVLLKELESCSYSCIIIAATNHPELLDKAIWRRFDRAIEVMMPSESERQLLIERHLKNQLGKITPQVCNYLIKHTVDINAADLCKLCEHIKRNSVIYKDKSLDLIVLEQLFILSPPQSKKEKEAICQEIKQAYPSISQRDIAQITQIPLSSVSRYLSSNRKDD